MDFRRRYDKLTDDINRVLTRAKSTSNVLGFKRSHFDSNYYGVLFGAPSAASSRFIEKLRTKYSKSDSNLQEAAEALKRKPAPLCLQEPELLEDIPHRPIRPHSGHKSSSSSCAAEHHNLQYYRNYRNRILFGEGNISASYNHPLKRSSTSDFTRNTENDDNLGYGFNHWYYNDNMSQVNGSHPKENGYDKVELRNKTKNVGESRPTSSGFQSFFKFFRASTSTDQVENTNNAYGKIRPRLRNSESPGNSSSSGTTSTSSPTLELGSSTELSSSSSTSCDSLFSIATTGFSFVPVDIYQPDGNTLKTQKELPVQQVTDSYRKRLKQRESFREIDLTNDLTLRKKYKLFSTDTLKSIEPKKPKIAQEPPYSEANLPSGSRTHEPIPSTSKQQDLIHSQKPRRTVSDSSKDIKAGAYVHVKGKRKAPPPPSPSSAQSSTAVTPRSTYGRRKKRPAPPPPIETQVTNNPSQLSTTSLLDDKDIRAIIEGTRFNFDFDIASPRNSTEIASHSHSMPKTTSSETGAAKKLTEEQKQRLIESVVKATTPDYKMQNDPEATPVTSPNSSMSNVPSFLMDDNVLTLDKGVYKFCKPERHEDYDEENEPPVTPLSPLSPRPWYKRSANAHKDYSLIPFKKDIFLKTIDRRKNKNKLEDDLPEVPYCRNSLLENGNKMNLLARLRENRSELNTQNKQEKRRSGIGIPNISELDREAAEILGQNSALKPVEELVNRQRELNRLDSVENEHEQSPPRSAKDLISKFEAQTNNSLGKVTVNPIFSNNENKTSGNKSTTASPIMKPKQHHGGQAVKPTPTNVDSIFKSWKCPYCTLENPSWKIVCLACEKLKPCDSVQKYFGPNPGSIRPQDGTKNIKDNSKNAKDEWDRKREKVLKYFRPNASPKGSNTSLNEIQKLEADKQTKGNALMKSASETSMFGNEPINQSRKSSSPNRGLGSPALGLRRLVLERTREKSIEKQKKLEEKEKIENPKVTQISIKYAVSEVKTIPEVKTENEYEQIKPKQDLDSEAKEEISFASDVLNAVLNKTMNDLNDSNFIKNDSISQPIVEDIKAERTEVQKEAKSKPPECSSSSQVKHQTSENHLEIKFKDTVFARKEVFVTNQAYIAPATSKESIFEEKKSEPEKNSVNTDPEIPIIVKMPTNLRLSPIPLTITDEKVSTDQQKETEHSQVQESPKFQEKKRQLSNREELEREKARLREMIREMNAKALADKYPVLERKENKSEIFESQTKKEIKPETPPQQPKLGAIKKFFGNKSEKVSSSVQTTGILKKTENDESMLPTPVVDISSKEIKSETTEDYANLPSKLASANIASKKEEEKVEKAKLRRQFRSNKGLDNFKASLNFPAKSMNRTNTLVINKLLRSLENAIADGEFDQAANYAMELAKMKVALSVTRQKDRPLSGAMGYDQELENLIVNMYVEDKDTSKGPIQISISPLWNVLKLKEKIQADFKLPVNKQRWIFFDKLADDDTKTLFDYKVIEKGADIYLYLVDTVPQEQEKVKEARINEIKTSLNKTIELQKALDSFEAEVAKSPPPRRKHFSPYADVKPKPASNFTPADTNILNVSDTEDEKKEKNRKQQQVVVEKVHLPSTLVAPVTEAKPSATQIDPHAWTCTLCTLVNHHCGRECAACAHPRANKVQEWPADVRKSEARRFLGNLLDPTTEINPVPKPQRGNVGKEKTSAGTSTSNTEIIPSQTNIVMTALVNQPNPNITKTKYRGVDNYNPNAPYVFPTVAEVLQSNVPIIKTVMLKNPDKFVEPQIEPLPPAIPPLPAVMPKSHAGDTRTGSNRRKKKLAPQPPGHGTNNRKSTTYLELLNLDNAGIVPNVEPFECTICFNEYQEGEGAVLRDCLHIFCKECLSYAIQYCEEPEVKCPYKDTDYSCEMVLQDREIRALVSPDIYEKHLAKSVRLAENQIENAFHCMTPNCRGWCIYEDNVNTFRCPVCRILNCLTCRAIHDGLNCKQYQERLKNNCDNNVEAKRTIGFLQEMVEKGEAMNCPTCQVIVMKKWGCDWLKCSICKTEICWITRGPRWGPAGKGDTSAGCKCGVNGKKCHEKCNYCH